MLPLLHLISSQSVGDVVHVVTNEWFDLGKLYKDKRQSMTCDQYGTALNTGLMERGNTSCSMNMTVKILFLILPLMNYVLGPNVYALLITLSRFPHIRFHSYYASQRTHTKDNWNIYSFKAVALKLHLYLWLDVLIEKSPLATNKYVALLKKRYFLIY